MASGWTNKGLYLEKEMAWKGTYNGGARPSTWYLALIKNTVVPTASTDFFAELTEVDASNGYSVGGSAITFGTVTESDAPGYATVAINDVEFSAVGGDISGISYAVLLPDMSEYEPGDTKEVLAYYDLTGPRTITNGSKLVLKNGIIKTGQ